MKKKTFKIASNEKIIAKQSHLFSRVDKEIANACKLKLKTRY